MPGIPIGVRTEGPVPNDIALGAAMVGFIIEPIVFIPVTGNACVAGWALNIEFYYGKPNAFGCAGFAAIGLAGAGLVDGKRELPVAAGLLNSEPPVG